MTFPTTSSKENININPRQRTYQALCRLLSDRASLIDWASFSEADWALFPVTAHNEGVAPAIYRTLAGEIRSGQPQRLSIPPGVLSRLEQEYYHNAAVNTMLLRELEGIQAALTRARVPFILIKGAALVQTVYADPAERVMNDLDLLVRRDQLHPAVRALGSAGYRRLMDNYFRYHVFLRGGGSGQTALELHWSLVLNDRRFPALIDWFWIQSQPLEAGEPCGRVLSPTAHLLYLAAHLALQHGGEGRLAWFYDLHRLVAVQGAAIGWDELLRQAAQVRWSQALHAALSGAQERFGSDLPGGILPRLGGQASTLSAPKPNGFRQAWQALDPPDRLRMLWGALFPRPAYLRWRYHPRPRWLWPLGYIRRWAHLSHHSINDA